MESLDKYQILRHFLVIFLPLLILMGVAASAVYWHDMLELRDRIAAREEAAHIRILSLTRTTFGAVMGDIRHLSTSPLTRAFIANPTPENRARLEADWASLATSREIYDQIRLIDETGLERVRINWKPGGPEIVTTNKLQNKADRYYVQEGMKQPPDVVYASQFDLNIEHGALEIPYKPMIRFVSRILDETSGQSWLVVINYLGQHYLDQIREAVGSGRNTWLINRSGDWLMGPDPALEWRFMLGNTAEGRLDQHIPGLWEAIHRHQRGRLELDGTLFTYTHLLAGPGPDERGIPIANGMLPFTGDDLPWTLVSRVDMSETLRMNYFSPERLSGLAFAGLLVALFIAGGGSLSLSLARRLHEEMRLRVELAHARDRLEGVVRYAPEGVLVLDEEGVILSANDAMGDLLRVNPVRLLGKKACTVLGDEKDGDARCRDLLHARLGHPGDLMTHPIRLDVRRPDGMNVPIEMVVGMMPGEERKEFVLHVRDISQRIFDQARMEQLSMAVEQTADSIVITDPHGVIEYVNPSFERVTGFSAAEAIGRRTHELLVSNTEDPSRLAEIRRALAQGESVAEVFVNRRKDGETYFEEKTISPIRDPMGTVTHYISTGKDVTERILVQERLHRLAHYDALTHLPNRALFRERLNQALLRAERSGGHIAIFFVDIDLFKQINDSLGHEAGDALLVGLASRFTAMMRKQDTLARLGGDEFAVLVEGCESPERAGHLAEKLLESLREPFEIGGQAIFVGASIGIAVYPEDGLDGATLLKHADVAMYRAKDGGRNNFQFFARGMNEAAIARLELETQLRQSIGSNWFNLHYQPRISPHTGTLTGAEALLRWEDPHGRPRSPAEVVPILESTGMILEIGEWIIKEACRQLARWQREGRELILSVNVSARQLLASPLHEVVAAALADAGCRDPKGLELELTESVLMSNVGRAQEMLGKLRALGVRIALDDFGTGYSSLAYLRRFPLDTLKIDREFTLGLPEDEVDAAIARAVVDLAHSAGLHVVAEGIEREEQRAFLQSLGVEELQGFLFSRPLPLDEFELWPGGGVAEGCPAP